MGRIVIGVIVVVLVIMGVVVYAGKSPVTKISEMISSGSSEAETKGKELSGGKCEGMEKLKLTHLPMQYEDFSMIIPYGLVVGDHVTPIDHQYFSPTVFRSPRDKYEVYAMADARLVSIEPRVKPEYTEYRLVFSMSCRVFYYYDLVTSLSEEILKAAGEVKQGRSNRSVNIPVKAGQLIGRIGGQTLDFAVWDTEVVLPGFVNSESYKEERWKIHTVDPLEYYTEELKQLAVSKYIRTVHPVSGKIDYDIDGKLIGNWFLEGTEGYRGTKSQKMDGYSQTHLAIVPNHIDPAVYIASFGNFGGKFRQLAIGDNNLDPKVVGPGDGIVKYTLFEYGYLKSDGERWDGMSLAKDLKVKLYSPVGCVMYQLVEMGMLKMEVFSGSECGEVSGFTKKAVLYTR
ncbi:MAG: hypothetical protein AAB909_04750 [Patescibacteria group bacterium]